MKSKKLKRNSSEEEITHRTAFSFLKNRFFSVTNQHHQQDLYVEPTHSSSSSSSAKTRPSSMMGLDSLLNPPTMDASTNEVPRRNSLTTTITKHKKFNNLSLDLKNTNLNDAIAFDQTTPVNNETNHIIEKRSSLIVLKEGYLFKKTDFKPFHKPNKLDRGWKLYKVVLRGHKLYLYKLTSESPLKLLFPSPHQQSQLKQLNSNTSISSSLLSNTTPVKLIGSDFDCEAQQVFFPANQASCHAQGAVFMELHPHTMQPKRQVYLILLNHHLYLCHRPNTLWKIEQTIPMHQLKLSHDNNNSHLNGGLLFRIINQTSLLGIYSTQNQEAAWIDRFQTMCNATQAPSGSTIHAFIEQILEQDDKLHVFLLTYILFTTGSRVLSELKAATQDQDRLLDIFSIWCRDFSLDVMGDVATGMMEILDSLSLERATKIKELVLETVNENANKTCEQKKVPIISSSPTLLDMEDDLVQEETELENISAFCLDGKRRDSINLSNLFITGFTPAVFLQIDPTSFAQQIYLFHFTKQKQFHKDLLNPLSYLPRPQHSVQMLNSLLFTTVAPHFLTKIIRNHILFDSQQDTEDDPLSTRSKLLEHWIRVGLALFELGDMTGWCSVAMGICSVGIIRLRETWKSVDRELLNKVQTDWIHILMDYGLFTQEMWADEWAEAPLNYSKVLDISQLSISKHDCTQSLPFFGTIRQFADRYRKHMKHNNHYFEPDMIPIDQCQCLYDTITHSLSTWKRDQAFSQHVDIMAVGPLQSFFEHSITDMMSVPHDYKYLQESSLGCEPKIFGQIFDKRKSMNGTNDISLSCLTFPSILDLEKKTNQINHNKMSSANSIQSIRSIMEEDGNRASLDSNRQHKKAHRRRTYSFPPGSSIAAVSAAASSSATASNSKLDLLETENSRTWLGNLISSRHHRSYSTKSLLEAHKKNRETNGDVILNVQHDQLVFRASSILLNQDVKKDNSLYSIDFIKKDDQNEQDALLVFIKAGNLDHVVDALVYNVAPYEERLKEQWQLFVLSNDISSKQDVGKMMMDQQELIDLFFTTYRPFCSTLHLLDMLRKRFMEAKSNCKPSMKRKNSLCLLQSYFNPDMKLDETDVYDWKKLAQIQLRILDLILFWIDEHPYDFIDQMEITKYMSNFLKNARDSVMSWRCLLVQQEEEEKNQEIFDIVHVIQERMDQLREQFIQKSISPCFDINECHPEQLKPIKELYRQLTQSTLYYHTTLQLATNKSPPLSVSDRPRQMNTKSPLDTFPPESLLEQLDQSVRYLFHAVTMQDWIQTCDVIDTQTKDIYAWLPAKKSSRTSRLSSALSPVIDGPSTSYTDHHAIPDETIIQDVFFAIQNAQRSIVSPGAFADDDLLLAFPSIIQYLFCMHFVIRSWVIHEICTMEIDSRTRIVRVEKFLQVVLLSKKCSEKMAVFEQKRVPGFVEYAIASGLVSPEVRLFTKTWHDIAIQYGHANLDHLDSLLNQIQKIQSQFGKIPNKLTSSVSFQSGISIQSFQQPQPQQSCQHLVPSLGWLFEKIIELGTHVPDTYDNKEHLIHVDKKRSLYHLLQFMMHIQIDLKEQTKQKSIHMTFLVSANNKETTWKDLKEYAIRENKKLLTGNNNTNTTSLVLRGPNSKSHVSRHIIFNKLVTTQMEKSKRELKEKDRIDKDLMTLQHKLQKKQQDQAKLIEKQQQKNNNNNAMTQQQQQPYSVMPRINSFFRGLRPNSTMTANLEEQLGHVSIITKASTVINLIHSTTSIASTYTKRDFVFRVVTEEGGQYLFQGMNREDMNEWIKEIRQSAKEGAAKRQSILVTDTINARQLVNIVNSSRNKKQTNQRLSVYGVHLDELMPDGKKIPMIVEKCIQEIEKRGLEEVGIYRVAGTGSIVSALKAAFNKNINKVNLSDPEWADINVVADAFKQFLRELPEPLLTYTCYDEFVTASASEDHDQRVYLIKTAIQKLPHVNYTLLKRIIEHLVVVTDFEATNHMYATNLAIVFGPTLLQPTPGPTSFATTMSNLGHHQNIVKYLILNYHYLFDVESEEIKGEQVIETIEDDEEEEEDEDQLIKDEDTL